MACRIVEVSLSAYPICESTLVNKLSGEARRLYYYLQDAKNTYERTSFTLDEIRDWPGYTSWRDTLDLMYEVASRNLGKVSKKGSNIIFTLGPA